MAQQVLITHGEIYLDVNMALKFYLRQEKCLYRMLVVWDQVREGQIRTGNNYGRSERHFRNDGRIHGQPQSTSKGIVIVSIAFNSMSKDYRL